MSIELHPRLVNESLRCLRELVFTLDNISNGTGITDELAKRILLKHPTLRDSDYDGRGSITHHLSAYLLQKVSFQAPPLMTGLLDYQRSTKTS